jgi:hypothetical protein
VNLRPVREVLQTCEEYRGHIVLGC